MDQKSLIQLVASEVDKNKVPCLLVGGFAVNHYKYTRATKDIDFLILRQDFEKFHNALLKAGYTVYDLKDNYARFSDQEPFRLDVDFLFVDRDTLVEMMKEAQKIELQGSVFFVPSLRHLIAMKLHAIKQGGMQREFKDLLDVAELIKKNKVDVRTKDFEDLCLKYGTEKTYKQLVAAMEG